MTPKERAAVADRPAEPAPIGGRRLRGNKGRFYGELIHVSRGRQFGKLPCPDERFAEPPRSREAYSPETRFASVASSRRSDAAAVEGNVAMPTGVHDSTWEPERSDITVASQQAEVLTWTAEKMEKDGGPRAARMRGRANQAVAAHDALRLTQATAVGHSTVKADAHTAPRVPLAPPD
eukprot:4229707-Alexandrium_andersonii.AAC.1